MNRGAAFGRLSAELAVIIVGVLVALFVDGAVEDGARIAEGTNLLRAIREDIALSVTHLEEQGATALRDAQEIGRALDLPLDGSVVASDSTFGSLHAAMARNGESAPVFRTYERLVATGGFELLDSELQISLVRMRSEGERLDGFRTRAAERWGLADAQIWGRHVSSEMGVGGPVRGAPLHELVRLLEVRNVLFSRQLFKGTIAGSSQDLVDIMNETLGLVDAELLARGAT